MDAFTRQNEAGADRMIAQLADDLNRYPGPGLAVMERVRCAVRQEINELWLQEQGSPELRSGLLQEVKQEVRSEIARREKWALQSRRGRASLHIPSWLGAVSAAAMLVVCVGLIRYIGYFSATSDPAESQSIVASAQTQVEEFVAAAQTTFNNDEFSNAVLRELKNIKNQLPGSAQVGTSSTSGLEDLSGALEDVLDQSDSKQGGMGRLEVAGGKVA